MAMDSLAITDSLLPKTKSSERVFSVERDLLGICRFRLKLSNMEWCVCLQYWLRSGLQLQLTGTRFTEEKTEDQVIDEVMFSDDVVMVVILEVSWVFLCRASDQ